MIITNRKTIITSHEILCTMFFFKKILPVSSPLNNDFSLYAMPRNDHLPPPSLPRAYVGRATYIGALICQFSAWNPMQIFPNWWVHVNKYFLLYITQLRDEISAWMSWNSGWYDMRAREPRLRPENSPRAPFSSAEHEVAYTNLHFVPTSTWEI